jgi:sec-independent protein translocase protein TatA
MFETLGAPELLIILVLVVLLFGAGRVGRLGKDLGTSVKEFRRAIKDDDETPASPPPAPSAQLALPAVTAPSSQGSTASQGVQSPPTAGPQLF